MIARQYFVPAILLLSDLAFNVCFLDHDARMLSDFFSHWLMYDDGDVFLRRKKLVSKFVSMPSPERLGDFAREICAGLQGDFDIVSEFVNPYVDASIQKSFSIYEPDFSFLKSRVDRLVAIPGHERLTAEIVRSAEMALSEARQYFCSRPDHIFMRIFGEENAPDDATTAADLAITLFGDGAHPTASALATELWLTLTNHRTPYPGAFLFLQDTPFQYIARTAVVDTNISGVAIPRGQRVVACIAHANRILSELRYVALTLVFWCWTAHVSWQASC